MNKKRNILLLLTCVILMTTGCSPNSHYAKEVKESKKLTLPIYTGKENQKYSEEALDFKDIKKNKYQAERLNIPNLSSIGGIICVDGQILISDTEKDCLILLDGAGNVLQQVGKTGSGELEFQSPNRMTLYKDQIYVIDKGNNRVQILNKDFTFADNIPTKLADEQDPDFRYEYIAVNENGIYLCPVSMAYSEIHLYNDKSGNYKKVGHNFCGPLADDKGKMHAINQYVKVYNKQEDTMNLSSMGPNWLFTLPAESDKLQKKKKFSPGMGISDFFFEGSNMYAVSTSYMSLFVYDNKGNYHETLVTLEEDTFAASLVKDTENNFWIGFDNGHLYCVRTRDK